MGLVNLLSARVEAVEGERGRVSAASGLILNVVLPPGIGPGDAVEVAIRPENVRLAPAGRDDDAAARGTVREATYLGNIAEYLVSLGGGNELRAQTHPSQQFAPGDSVAVTVDGASCRLFPRGAADAKAA
jgi:ABC-type Fe3+/spermidine/putrescine transport system ATPase subunit